MHERPTSDPAIRLNLVTLKLDSLAGPVNILRGIDLTIEAGERVALVGPSGSGKSSMMMIIAGLESATSGEVVVAGQSLAGLGEDALALFRRRQIGIVFQNFHLVPTMTAAENVALPLELARQRGAAKTARWALASVGLEHRLSHFPGQLSGGEQQRVALARAFAARPPLILADEPTGNLDGTTGEAVIDLLFGLTEESRSTLMLITHDRALADRCGRIVELHDGLIAGDGPGADQRAGPALAVGE